jgi:hypothetical protein
MGFHPIQKTLTRFLDVALVGAGSFKPKKKGEILRGTNFFSHLINILGG